MTNSEIDFAISFSEASTSFFIDVAKDKKQNMKVVFGEYMIEYQENTLEIGKRDQTNWFLFMLQSYIRASCC